MQPKIDRVRSLLLVEDTCLVIPPYQRPYEWNRDRWQSLIRDIVESLTTNREAHFIGVVITTESKPDCHIAKSPLLHKHIDIIDGQQRLLTLRIWLQAILDHSLAQGNDLQISFANVSCQETDIEDWELVKNHEWVSNYQNFKSDESGLLHAYSYFRWVLWLGQNAMTEQEPESLPKISRFQERLSSEKDLIDFWELALQKRSHSMNVIDSSLQIAKSVAIDNGTLLAATVDRLSLLVLEVNMQDEDPADIFNALNGQRTEMFQFDHLRNFVFANINDSNQRSELYNNSWKNVERQVVKQKIPVKGSSALDTYLYDLLISLGERRHQSVSKDKTARQFAKYYNSNRNSLGAISVAEKLILPNLISWTSIKKNGEPFDIGRKNYQLPHSVQTSLVSMDWMSSGPVVPLLLNIVNRYYHEQFSESDLKKGLESIESYLARHIISGEPLSPLRAAIMNICGKLGRNYSLDELERLLRDTKFKDAELKKRVLVSKGSKTEPYGSDGMLYELRTSKQILAIFQGIERKRAGEHCANLLRNAQDDVLTIDHIFPQSPDRWKGDIREWEASVTAMEKRLHTLGNLAVIPKSINIDMSNERFNRKKEILSENSFIKLEVNTEWQSMSIKKWMPEDIDARAERLLDDFLSFYPY